MNQLKPEQIVFETETKIKIGAVTYIVAAHFDERREMLNCKISNLLKDEINRQINARQTGLSQRGVL